MTTQKQVNRKFSWSDKRIERIDIPPDKVRDIIAPWVYKVLLRIKQEEAMKQKQGGMANGHQG